MLPIWMVDGESIWQELYPRAAAALVWLVVAIAGTLLGSGTVFTSLLLRLSDGKRARCDNAQAVIRCDEPVQFQVSRFLARNRAASPMGIAVGGLTNCAMME